LNIIKKHKFVLYILCWFFLWTSLNVDLFRISNFGKSFVDNINSIRALLPTFILFILLFVLLSNNLLKSFFNKKNIYLFFFIFFAGQVIGGLDNLDKNITLNKYIVIQALGLLIASIATILLIYLIHNEKSKLLDKYLIYTSISILSIYFIPILIKLMWNYSLSPNIYAYHEILIQEGNKGIFNLPVSRSTGISRSILIITIFLLCFNYFKNNKTRMFVYFVISVLSTSIFLINSKFANLSIIIIYLLIIFKNKLYNKSIIKFLFLFLIIPFLLSQLIFNKKINDKYFLNFDIKNRFIDDFNKSDTGVTSGRVDIWISSLDVFKSQKKYFFGLGTQADRLYLSNIKDIYSSNSSNAFLYSILSGGIVSSVALIIFNFIVLIRIYKYFFSKSREINLSYNILNFSIFIYLLLLLRSIVENSFTLFSIDFLLYLQSCMIIIKNINLNYQKNIYPNKLS
jgi:hypothetical protein